MKKAICLIGVILTLCSCSQHKKKTDYLTTFAHAYGYVKYFHPSDEATGIDWKQFAVYGASEIEKCTSKKDLIETLNALFLPIAPSVRFFDEDSITAFNLDQIQPDYPEDYCLTYWQHRGVGTGMDYSHKVYESLRVIQDCETDKPHLFDFHFNAPEIISKEIGSGVYCQIPLTLYRNKKGTYPKAEPDLLRALKRNVRQSSIDPKNTSVRLGNIINTYNVFQHFHPYFDVVDVNWEQALREALLRSYKDKDGRDHLITLQKFTALLQDGHISINGMFNERYVPLIAWEWIEDQLVITGVFDTEIDLMPGDVISRIDGKSPKKHFKEIHSRISAATQGWLVHRAAVESLLGPENSLLRLKTENKTIELPRKTHVNSEYRALRKNKKAYEGIDDSIFYLNLDVIEMSKIHELLPRLEKCNAIICDLRGYPNSNHEWLLHLLSQDDTTKAWMQSPLIIYPDQENPIQYEQYDWIEFMKARQPYLGDKRIVFIVNGQAISYAESFLAYVEGYNLATIVGQPTAGTNGNVNTFRLSGGYKISFTGMKVLKHDGTQHHGIGILPDVYVTKTIGGVKEGRDEFLEKAIEIARQD